MFDGSLSPLEIYQQGIADGDYQEDVAQRQAMQLLNDLHARLMQTHFARAGALSSIMRTIVRKLGWQGHDAALDSRQGLKGLYLWGGVGRGKTLLMDTFFEALPGQAIMAEGQLRSGKPATASRKLRLHFHHFMREVHRQLGVHQGVANPLKKVAESFAERAAVICLDEFFVSDITDAMLLAGLLEEMFSLGLVLVATSNTAPDDLYKDGLQRSKFLPAIALLKEFMQVHHVAGEVDHRLRLLNRARIYHWPLDDAAEAGLAKAFADLSPDAGQEQAQLLIEGRPIQTRLCGDGLVWFDFAALCDGPRSQNDYIEIARLFKTVLLGRVPVFGSDSQPDMAGDDQARRFISLVDEFYDRQVKLIISAAAAISDLYQGSQLAFEFQRTQSRLQEMQSQEYLAREHRP